MSSGDLEAPTTAGTIATQKTIGKIRILQGQLMIPGRAETVLIATASDQQHRYLTPGGIENPTTSSSESTINRSEKGKMRMKVTGEDTRAAAATKGQAMPVLRAVSPVNAAHKASSAEASDRHQPPVLENARSIAASTDSLGQTIHIKNTHWLPVRTMAQAGPTSSSFTDSAPNATNRASRTVVTSDPARIPSTPLVIRGAATDAGSSIRVVTSPQNVKGESVAYTSSFLQTNKSKQALHQQPITVSYRPINQQPAPTAVMQNNTMYKVLHVASKSTNQSSSDSTERTAIVLKKMSNGAENNPSSSSKKSTHDRVFSGGGSDTGRVMENDSRTLPSPTVESKTQTGDETRGTWAHGTHVPASSQTEQQTLPKENESAKAGGEGDTVDERSNEPSEKSSTGCLSADAAGKVSREVKLLKETQSQSKILAEYIDEASRQGKLRLRRSASGTPTSTSVASPVQVSTVTGPVAHRKRLQSRCFAAEDDSTQALDTGTKRPGMRSESIEFRMKNRKFLNDMHDKSDMALVDDYEEEYEEAEETHRYHPVGTSDSDLNVSIDSKQLDDTLNSLAEPPKPGYDRFCFRCKINKNDCLVGCSSCIRSFHKGCARPTYSEATWSCQDCRASKLAHETNPFPTEGDVNLPECLKYALESLLYSAEMNRLFNPVDKTAINLYEDVVTNHMDLARISSKVEAKEYKTTEDFLSDLSWIVHNMTLCRDTKMLASAKSLYRTGRDEIILLETCRECYRHLKTKPEATWFAEVCKKPHLLVWGKVKGFPYWPGKLMNINNNNQALVVFFGQHDKAWIAVKECYVLSKRDPNSKSSKKAYWNKSLKEVEEHVANLILKFGCFNYAPYLTALDAARVDDHLREMLPNAFKPIAEVPARQEPVVLTIITSVDGKMTASATTSDKAATDTLPSGSGESSQKRITRRASKAAMVLEDHVNSMDVSNVEPSTEGEVNNTQALAKKRKSVCFDRHVSELDEEGKIESLVIRRNSGNWATEPVSKRRKSVARTRRDSQKITPSQDTKLTAPAEDSPGDRAVDSSIVATAPTINDQRVAGDGTTDEVLKTNNNDESVGQHNAGSTSGNVAEVPELSNPNGREAANATGSTSMDVSGSPSGSKEPVDLGQQKVGIDTDQSEPSGIATVNKATQPVISVPVPIKEEVPDAEEDVSSTSTSLPSALVEPHVQSVVTAETKISATNQKARKSFPGSSAIRAPAKPAGKPQTMMTIIPKAVGPERNSPLLQLAGAATGEPVATSSTATSNEAARGDTTSSSQLASVAVPASRSPVMVRTANEIPDAMLRERVASGVSRINNAIGNAVRSCAPEPTVPTTVPTGAASIATFPPAENTEINLPDDLDVIIIEEPDSEAAVPAANSVTSPARYANRQNRLPILHPKPAASVREGDDKLSVVDLIDGYVSQVADQSRHLLEQTLGKLTKAGSLEAKVMDLTRQLELVNRRHEIEKEQLEKQIQHLYNEKVRAVSLAKQQMWCRRCQLEANFYCCWNTAYCSTKCQQEHWREHEQTCEQKVCDDRGSTMSGTSSAFASPAYGSAAKKKGHARQRSVGGYQDLSLSAPSSATTVAPLGSRVMSTIPAGQRLVSPGASRRQQPSHFTTPKIHMVHSQATSLHNLPYSGNPVNGGTAQRRLQPSPGSTSTSVRAELNNDERRVSGGHTLASSVSNGTVGRIISTAPALVAGAMTPTITFTPAGRGGSTSSSTGRPAPPLPQGVWNQIIVQPSLGANAKFVDPSVYGIGGPRGVGGFMHLPATVTGGSVPSAIGTTNNGSAHGDAGLARDAMARRHPR